MRRLLVILFGLNTVPLSVTHALRKERALRLQAEQDLREAQAEVVDLRWGLDAEKRACERYIAERDIAAGQAKFWASEAATSARLMLDMGAAREAATLPVRAGAVVHYPVFGRRRPFDPSVA